MRGLRGNVAYVGPWVAWIRGSVDCMGQFFTWVAWVTWVKMFFTRVNILRGLRGSNIFLRGSLRGSEIFAWDDYNYFASLFTTNLDQTLFDFFIIFE